MRIVVFTDDIGQLISVLAATSEVGYRAHPVAGAKALMRALLDVPIDLLIMGTQDPARQHCAAPITTALVRTLQQVPVLQLVADVPAGWQTSDEDVPDDFAIWPAPSSELQSRMLGLLRRRPASFAGNPEVMRFGAYRLDKRRHIVERDGTPVLLRPREFDLAAYLFRNLGRTISRQHLMQAIWHTKAALDSRSMDTHMSRLRGQLDLTGAHGFRLTAIYNRGYRLDLCKAEAPMVWAA